MSVEITPKDFFNKKTVLVAGLGVFGGGISTVNFVSKWAKKVIVTDLKTENNLRSSLLKIKKSKNTYFVLGRHRDTDFKVADIVMINPGIPKESKYLKISKKNGGKFENVASLLARFVNSPIIGVTGTRGKTTTTHYIASILSGKYKGIKAIGNPQRSILTGLSCKGDAPVVAEFSSWQLEIMKNAKKSPHISVITNIYPDHLNRYKNMKEYVLAKTNIFKYQTKNDILILPYHSKWKSSFVNQKPNGRIYYFSKKILPKKINNGIYLNNSRVILRIDRVEKTIINIKSFRNKRGSHNVENLLVAIIVSLLFDPSVKINLPTLNKLPYVYMRQEIIYKKPDFYVVNDSASTSPDATVAAIDRFINDEIVLITGGTDKKLDFSILAKKIKKEVSATNLILLCGSGTAKLLNELKKIRYKNVNNVKNHKSLKECIIDAINTGNGKKKKVILFSPGAASFELFKNEFDRGEKFNKLIKSKMISNEKQ